MSEKLFLDAIMSLNGDNMDDDTISNVCDSLIHILTNDNFNDTMKKEALIKQKEFHAIMKMRMICEKEKVVKKKSSVKKIEITSEEREAMDNSWMKDESRVFTSDDEELINKMFRSEIDGSLSFTLNGVRWDWNSELRSWDFTKEKE